MGNTLVGILVNIDSTDGRLDLMNFLKELEERPDDNFEQICKDECAPHGKYYIEIALKALENASLKKTFTQEEINRIGIIKGVLRAFLEQEKVLA